MGKGGEASGPEESLRHLGWKCCRSCCSLFFHGLFLFRNSILYEFVSIILQPKHELMGNTKSSLSKTAVSCVVTLLRAEVVAQHLWYKPEVLSPVLVTKGNKGFSWIQMTCMCHILPPNMLCQSPSWLVLLSPYVTTELRPAQAGSFWGEKPVHMVGGTGR